MADPVYKPSHYKGKLETIEIIEKTVKGLKGKKAYCLGNVIKYTSRAGKKGSAKEDLKKANNYAHRAVTGKWKKRKKKHGGKK